MNLEVWNENCLHALSGIPDQSVDLILTDLPYATTAAPWDKMIPFEPLWQHYRRVIKPNKAIVLFGTQPFTSKLICSNLEMFKYTWVWKKPRPGGYVNAKLKPMKDAEDICVFSTGATANGSKKNMPYYPQGLVKVDRKWKRPQKYVGDEGMNFSRDSHELERVIEYTNYPRTIIEFDNGNHNQIHPTEKPIALLEYLIRTYSLEGECVLDSCAGGFSTALAAIRTGRNFLGIELDPKFFQSGLERLRGSMSEQDNLIIH